MKESLWSRKWLALALACALLGSVGCGGGGEAPSTAAPKPMEEVEPPDGPPIEIDPNGVNIEGNAATPTPGLNALPQGAFGSIKLFSLTASGQPLAIKEVTLPYPNNTTLKISTVVAGPGQPVQFVWTRNGTVLSACSPDCPGEWPADIFTMDTSKQVNYQLPNGQNGPAVPASGVVVDTQATTP